MNDKIDEFALQSQKEYGDFDGSITALDYRKFAELIIKECADVADRNFNSGFCPVGLIIKCYFGVE